MLPTTHCLAAHAVCCSISPSGTCFARYFQHEVTREKVARYLKEGDRDLNEQDNSGETLLTYCCGDRFAANIANRFQPLLDKIAVVKDLLRRGANINQCNRAGRSPVYLMLRTLSIPRGEEHYIEVLWEMFKSNGFDFNAAVCCEATLIQICYKKCLSIWPHQEEVGFAAEVIQALLPLLLEEEDLQIEDRDPCVAVCIKNGLSFSRVRRVMKRGCYPHIVDADGKNGLHLIASQPVSAKYLARDVTRKIDIFKLLLPWIDVRSTDHAEKTPHDYWKGSIESVRWMKDDRNFDIDYRPRGWAYTIGGQINKLQDSWEGSRSQLNRAVEVTYNRLERFDMCREMRFLILRSIFCAYLVEQFRQSMSIVKRRS